jgi:hypothetical protein
MRLRRLRRVCSLAESPRHLAVEPDDANRARGQARQFAAPLEAAERGGSTLKWRSRRCRWLGVAAQ